MYGDQRVNIIFSNMFISCESKDVLCHYET